MGDGRSLSSGSPPILLPVMCCRAIVAYIAFVDALRSDAANAESIHSAANTPRVTLRSLAGRLARSRSLTAEAFGPRLLGSAAVDRVSPTPPVLVCVADVDLPTAVAALHGIRAFAVAPSSCGVHGRPRSPARLIKRPWTMIINRTTGLLLSVCPAATQRISARDLSIS